MTTQRKTVLITGAGSRRVGARVAAAFAGRGWNVAVHYRSSPAEAAAVVEELRRSGVDAEAFRAELSDESAVRATVAGALQRFGRLDALVCCAAVWRRKRLEDVTAADVRDHFEANTLGTFLIAREAGLAMVRSAEGGCIVTVGDWAVARPYPDYAAYFPSKGAVPAMTRSLAVELGLRNPRVRVNCVLPGPVMLPTDLPEAEKQAAIRGTLVKREGTPDHVAAAVLSLVENDFITGACLAVDGGRGVYAAGD